MKRRQQACRLRLNPDAVWDRLNRLNKTQNDLASMVGITSGYLSQLMTGSRFPIRRCAEGPSGCAGSTPLRGPVHCRGRGVRPVTLPPPDLLFGVPFLPEDFSERLEHFKEISGLPWDVMASCLGVDPRQLQRWRQGTRPSGDGLFALLTLAARFPGGVHMLLGVNVVLPEPDVLEALAGGAGFREAFLADEAGAVAGEDEEE